ncbi:MAG: hypothetical protein CME70_06180 [Halobacteriovorax sp.]|nr:hypothetical protein [Halobacteriovorax sp.]
MSKTFTLEQLTEGIRQRHLGTANRRLVEKWSRTGLLRGLDSVYRENMAMLLENQAAQQLREANSLGDGSGTGVASGDIRGFTNIAFPIVRRVFGGLVANELVSIQPMSLPSGLLFYLDYTYGSNVGASASPTGGTPADGTHTYSAGASIYSSPVGNIQAGSDALGGMYNLAGSGYSRVHENVTVTAGVSCGAHGATNGAFVDGATLDSAGKDAKLLQFDPAVLASIDDDGEGFSALIIDISGSDFNRADKTMIKDFAVHGHADAGALPGGLQEHGTSIQNIRRLNQRGDWDPSNLTNPWTPNAMSGDELLVIVGDTATQAAGMAVSFVQAPTRASGDSGDSLVVPSFESDFDTEPSPEIPEIDIKIESIAVTAVTRKLRARWSPELAQDLNAYHSLDAEVELTQILSEQIALELDREILNDLLTSASGANLFWSRAPGKFVNKNSGAEVFQTQTPAGAPGPQFTGTVREWYETLTETVIDCANTIHRKTLRGSANFMVVGPDVATILESSVLYRPSYSLDGDGQVGAPMSLGAEKVGTLSNRFTVYKDPYFPRNKILVGYKGGSYLETGYVYAPYVPLIVTPTIFAPEDFTPRKGVMTRYGKKMVRADFYGTVTVLDLDVI